MKAIYTLKLSVLIGLMGLSACSEQDDNAENDLNSPISLAPVTVQSLAEAAGQASEVAGEYYFGWKNTVGTDTYIPVTVNADGSVGANSGKIDAYWESVQNGQYIYLSNTLNFTDVDNVKEPKDILYHKRNDQYKKAVTFTLNHKMAQAQVELTIPTDWSVKEVWLTGLYRQHCWSNQTGNVTTCGQIEAIYLTTEGSSQTTCSILLPPQGKGADSELYVVVNDGKADRTYHRKLPNVMAQYKSGTGVGTIWEDVLLKFIAGRRLKLTANISESSDYQIYFTGATLQNWVDKSSGTIAARPAGIYTVSDWNAFATAYTANPKDETRLSKYGVYTNGTWLFTLQRALNFTGVSSVKNAGLTGNDKITAKDESTCTITGKNENELGITGHIEGTITFN